MSPKGKKVWWKRGPLRFPGIGEHADALGVTTHHLRLVLKGKRESRSLLARYQELTGRKAG